MAARWERPGEYHGVDRPWLLYDGPRPYACVSRPGHLRGEWHAVLPNGARLGVYGSAGEAKAAVEAHYGMRARAT